MADKISSKYIDILEENNDMYRKGFEAVRILNKVESTCHNTFHFFAETADVTEWIGYVIQQTFNKRGTVVLLSGEIGAGKSSIARGFIRAFCKDPLLSVPSPSYLLCLSYQDDCVDVLNSSNRVSVHHMDPYRLKNSDKMVGLIDFDYALEKDICLVEWPDKMPKIIQEKWQTGIRIHVGGIGAQSVGREVTFTAIDDESAAIISSWRSKNDFPYTFQDFSPLISNPGDKLLCQSVLKPLNELLPLNKPFNEWLVLGIESSCDDTGAAVIKGDGSILAQKLASQADIHEQYGGVKPDAARDAHANAITSTVDDCLFEANITVDDLDAVAVTVGPGLALCLQVGGRHAQMVAQLAQKPLVPVHHMEAHALVTKMPLSPEELKQKLNGELGLRDPAEFPALILLVSGGHSLLVFSEGVGKHRLLGIALDDSVGECFDKTARAMGVTKVPGGPWVEKLAKKAQNDGESTIRFPLPEPLKGNRNHSHSCNFSFSGLKTVVGNLVAKERERLGLSDIPPLLDIENLIKEPGVPLMPKQEYLSVHETLIVDGCKNLIHNNNQNKQKRKEDNNDCHNDNKAKRRKVFDGNELISNSININGIVSLTEFEREKIYQQTCAEICSSFQSMAVRVLQQRTRKALNWLQDDYENGVIPAPVKSLVVAGGVAANQAVRSALEEVAREWNVKMSCPPLKLCMDNGVMVAWAGIERLRLGLCRRPLPKNHEIKESDIEVIARWPLGPMDPRGIPMAGNNKTPKKMSKM